MCEILVFLGNNTHADSVKDRRGCYKRGMPVIVHDDGHTWGREESKQSWINETRHSGTVNTTGTQVVFTPDLRGGGLPLVPDSLKNLIGKSFVVIGTEQRLITDIVIANVNNVFVTATFVQTAFSVEYTNTPATIINDPNNWPMQGKMAILKLPGVLATKAEEFLASQTEDDTGAETGDVFRRKRWKVLIDSVPAGVRNTIASTGEYSTTVANIRNFLKRNRDNAQYVGFD